MSLAGVERLGIPKKEVGEGALEAGGEQGGGTLLLLVPDASLTRSLLEAQIVR